MGTPSIKWQSFIAELRRSIVSARDDHKTLALIIVEIRQFHVLSLQHGFNNSEALVRLMLERTSACMKNATTVTRIGSDKLVIILSDVAVPELMPIAAQKIFTALTSPYTIYGAEMTISPGIGVALFPQHAATAEALMAEAEFSLAISLDTAAPYVVACESLAAGNLLTSEMENNLHHALFNDQIKLYYQPQINLTSLQPEGAEALMRWVLPDGNTTSPSQFIPLAESSGKITRLTEWALNTAMREMVALESQGQPLSVSVNVSPESIYDPDLLVTVESALAIWGLSAQRLTLEITESTLIKNHELCFKHLSQLRELGIKIALDDFGTGFSSLSYFKSIPADEIKIDQSFVKNMEGNNDDVKIIELIIDLSHKFGLQVVAEGIESKEVLLQLQAMGCDYGQGYYMARPMEFSAYRQWLASYDAASLAR